MSNCVLGVECWVEYFYMSNCVLGVECWVEYFYMSNCVLGVECWVEYFYMSNWVLGVECWVEYFYMSNWVLSVGLDDGIILLMLFYVKLSVGFRVLCWMMVLYCYEFCSRFKLFHELCYVD